VPYVSLFKGIRRGELSALIREARVVGLMQKPWKRVKVRSESFTGSVDLPFGSSTRASIEDGFKNRDVARGRTRHPA